MCKSAQGTFLHPDDSHGIYNAPKGKVARLDRRSQL